MRVRLFIAMYLIVIARFADAAAAPVELELATERGVQITAPQQWVQLLAGIGITRVRIRGGRPGDEPNVTKRGGPQGASYHVVGMLTSRDELRLPGGTFSRVDRLKLKDYFARLAADGSDAVTAPRGRFGLTEKELTTVLSDLAQPVEFETKGQPPREVIGRLQTKLSLKLAIDPETDRALRTAAPVVDELKGIAAGTALAIALRNYGLVMRPEKSRGQPIVYRVVAAGGDAVKGSTLGKMSSADMQYWPIGWEPEKSPGEVVPSLFESLNAEIDGFTLGEALAAISPRLSIPLYLDHAALKSLNIDPAKIQVQLAPMKISYKRVIDRIVAQARLGSEIRVDEAGMPFLWITR
jgi:hypothetical protein